MVSPLGDTSVGPMMGSTVLGVSAGTNCKPLGIQRAPVSNFATTCKLSAGHSRGVIWHGARFFGDDIDDLSRKAWRIFDIQEPESCKATQEQAE